MAVIAELLAANERYAAGFAKGDLPMPPGRQLAILTCMDARIDPAKALGLDEGDAHVIRNAGGVPLVGGQQFREHDHGEVSDRGE